MPDQLASTASRPVPGQPTVAARTSPAGYSSAGADGATSPALLPALLRHLDVPLVVLGAAIALALGTPVLGCVIGALAWVLQSILAQTDRRWIRKATEPRMQLGLNLFEAFGRIWLLAGAIVAAGVIGGRADGLTAALVIFGAYTVAFAIRVLSGPPARSTAPTAPRPPGFARSARPAAVAPQDGPMSAVAAASPSSGAAKGRSAR